MVMFLLVLRSQMYYNTDLVTKQYKKQARCSALWRHEAQLIDIRRDVAISYPQLLAAEQYERKSV